MFFKKELKRNRNYNAYRFYGIAVVIICVLACLVSCDQSANVNSQSYTLSVSGNMYCVENNVSHKIIKKTGNFNEAYNTAVNKLENKGGYVRILAGKYQVNEPLYFLSNLKIEGDGEATIMVVSDEFKGGDAIFIADSLNDISISNLVIKQTNSIENISGISISHCGTSKVIDVFVLGTTEYGIWLKNNSFLCEVRGCKLGKIGKSAIYLDKLLKGRAGDWLPNLISNCTVYTSGMGIELNKSIVANIVNCVVFQTRGHAYYLHDQSNSVIISGCRAHQTGDVAVMIDNSHELNVSSNVFAWQEKDGIVLDDVAWATVSANEFIDNGSYNPMDSTNMQFNLNGVERPFRVRQNMEQVESAGYYNGVTLRNKCRGVVVSANAIFNWPAAHPMKFGIEEDETCYQNNFIANNINYCKNGNVSIKGKNSIAANNVFAQFPPHAGNQEILQPKSREIQGFDLRLMDYYIDQQIKY